VGEERREREELLNRDVKRRKRRRRRRMTWTLFPVESVLSEADRPAVNILCIRNCRVHQGVL